MQIKNRFTDEVIFEDDAKTIKETVENAVKNGASLNGASLNRASLNWASLNGASLNGASLNGAKIEFFNFPSIRTISSIRLNNLPDSLTIELMRRDAFGHPYPKLFDDWAKGGICPYQNEDPFWLFGPKKSLWSPGLPKMTDRDLIVEICKSQGWYIRKYLPMPESKKREKKE